MVKLDAIVISLLVVGTIAQSIGFHEIDLAWNMDRTAIDVGLSNVAKSRINIYHSGLLKILIGLISLSLAVIIKFI